MKEEIIETVKVYLRKRPFLRGNSSSSGSRRERPTFNDEIDSAESNFCGIESISKNHKSCNYISSQNRLKQQFYADYIFDTDSAQNDVYETVAKPIVESCLEGYAGVILAYGPTSSGKTFTMRGNEHDSRGIMPR